jgi:hypothetical protein
MADRKRKGGRTTPKGTTPGRAPRPAPRRPDEPTPRVGRRPSSPALLFVVAGLWIASAVTAAFTLQASWRLIPAICFFGIGLLYLRAALTTVVRRGERREPDRDDA